MPWTFNPFTGNFDQKGSGGGGASYIDGEVQNFSALPETVGSPAVDSAYLVREAEGTWLINRKPAGIYVRTANTGVRADDWTYAGEFPDVFNDANFLLYDNGDSTKSLAFQLSGITTGTTRTLTAPDASGTIALTSSLTDTQIFTANGTWTKPAGAKYCDVELVGGGGGGGGGRRGATSTDRGGGGGGGGGGRVFLRLRAADLGSTESVTVGAGGTGGATAADDTDGGTGADGGDTSFSVLTALGGAGGAGGNATAVATRGIGKASGTFVGTDGDATTDGGNGGFGATAPLGGESATYAPAGGGGARITTANNTNGSSGGGGAVAYGGGGVFTHFVAGGAIVLSFQSGSNAGASFGHIGTGGSGARYNNSGWVPAAGGNGGLYGGGGGGGSGGLNASGGSTAGGDGGAGIAVITTYF